MAHKLKADFQVITLTNLSCSFVHHQTMMLSRLDSAILIHTFTSATVPVPISSCKHAIQYIVTPREKVVMIEWLVPPLWCYIQLSGCRRRLDLCWVAERLQEVVQMWGRGFQVGSGSGGSNIGRGLLRYILTPIPGLPVLYQATRIQVANGADWGIRIREKYPLISKPLPCSWWAPDT